MWLRMAILPAKKGCGLPYNEQLNKIVSFWEKYSKIA